MGRFGWSRTFRETEPVVGLLFLRLWAGRHDGLHRISRKGGSYMSVVDCCLAGYDLALSTCRHFLPVCPSICQYSKGISLPWIVEHPTSFYNTSVNRSPSCTNHGVYDSITTTDLRRSLASSFILPYIGPIQVNIRQFLCFTVHSLERFRVSR